MFRREYISELLELYYGTFSVSCKSLNHCGDLFSLEELKQEFNNKVIFGFLEGIWYLDIIYQGQRPEPYKQSSIDSGDEINTAVQMSSADSLEQEEIRQKRKLLSQTSLINEEVNNYRREFFSMLEDVVKIVGEDLSSIADEDAKLCREGTNFQEEFVTIL